MTKLKAMTEIVAADKALQVNTSVGKNVVCY